jgi:hypothetical protein
MNRGAIEQTKEQIMQLRPCKHGNHIVDALGIGVDGGHLTDCPDHPTFNAAYAAAFAEMVRRATRPRPKNGNVGSRQRVRAA